ncbi:MAG: hypothetical protein U0519_00495 [Candidatus Gracilibacteria bacterium]
MGQEDFPCPCQPIIPRYVVFQDGRGPGLSRKIIYPNIFQATSSSAFLSQLQAKENEIQNIANAAGIPLTMSGQLTGIVSAADDVYADSKKSEILSASPGGISDALAWRDMNIDQKHEYAVSHYLGQSMNPYVEKMPYG